LCPRRACSGHGRHIPAVGGSRYVRAVRRPGLPAHPAARRTDRSGADSEYRPRCGLIPVWRQTLGGRGPDSGADLAGAAVLPHALPDQPGSAAWPARMPVKRPRRIRRPAPVRDPVAGRVQRRAAGGRRLPKCVPDSLAEIIDNFGVFTVRPGAALGSWTGDGHLRQRFEQLDISVTSYPSTCTEPGGWRNARVCAGDDRA
jgi:hypothetical protein